MSTDTNAAIARSLYDEAINKGNRALLDDILAPDMVAHDTIQGRLEGAAAFKGLLAFFDAAFPGHTASVEQVIAQGDYVAVLHTHYATHGGPFMGLPPTGREIVVPGVELFRLRDGRIAEFWRFDNDAGMLMQLGLLQPPGQQ
jgi:steroid delta-isomerase-like uncharacterized protein